MTRPAFRDSLQLANNARASNAFEVDRFEFRPAAERTLYT